MGHSLEKKANLNKQSIIMTKTEVENKIIKISFVLPDLVCFVCNHVQSTLSNANWLGTAC